MKIGLSYSRCVRDIVDGKVDVKDVLVIVASTNFDPCDDKQWAGIWSGYGGGQTFGSPYSNPEWMDYPADDEQKFRDSYTRAVQRVRQTASTSTVWCLTLLA
jgi:hypothetical protein